MLYLKRVSKADKNYPITEGKFMKVKIYKDSVKNIVQMKIRYALFLISLIVSTLLCHQKLCGYFLKGGCKQPLQMEHLLPCRSFLKWGNWQASNSYPKGFYLTQLVFVVQNNNR